MTLEVAIELQMKLNEEHPQKDGRPFKTGLYIETKNVGFYKERGVDIAGLLYNALKKYGLETVEKAQQKLPIIIESFEEETLLDFRFKYGSDLPMIFLMHDWITTYNLTEISRYAHGIGPRWNMFFNESDPEDYRKPSKLIDEAHKLGMLVHGYIF
jgi:glycerophosphoryl diester phosphodiesterase